MAWLGTRVGVAETRLAQQESTARPGLRQTNCSTPAAETETAWRGEMIRHWSVHWHFSNVQPTTFQFQLNRNPPKPDVDCSDLDYFLSPAQFCLQGAWVFQRPWPSLVPCPSAAQNAKNSELPATWYRMTAHAMPS
jgi:hypothetical protein